MTLVALVTLGVITAYKLPVSLLPNIDIPEITIQINYKNTSARELENAVVKPIRNQLLQLNHLKDIKSETKDGYSILNLKFDYKTNINYAFIETNEKIDALMSSMPREMERPKIIKACASDIPVFKISIIPKDEYWYKENDLLKLSELAESVIKKRIEQLDVVAMVDISGLQSAELAIIPDIKKIQNLNIDYSKIENAISNNNIDLGNITIKNGQYQYNIRFSSILQTKEDIGNIYLSTEKKRIIQLKNIAEIKVRPQKRTGMYLYDNKEAIIMSVIKQADAQMAQLKESLDKLVDEFNNNYNEIEFKVSQDQTQLLKFSINNLKQSLLFGGLLAMVIMFIFMRDYKSPFLIIISIPASLIISMFFLYLSGISINIISLSGLILGVGMMVDNSIIVIDNINQYLDKSYSLNKACILGTNEIIRPLISSVLTTCAVFVPLVSLSDISGALFYDQAVTIAISLTTSLLVSIMILPVLFRLFYIKNKNSNNYLLSKSYNLFDIEKIYEKSINFIFKNKLIVLLLFVLLIPLGIFLFKNIKKQSFPDIKQTAVIFNIDWNENINLDENKKRIINLFEQINTPVLYKNILIGEQQFLLNKEQEKSQSEASVFIKTKSTKNIKNIKNEIDSLLKSNYQNIEFSFQSPKNVFEQLFKNDESSFVVKIQSINKNIPPKINKVNNFITQLQDKPYAQSINEIPIKNNLVISILSDKLLIYNVSYQTLIDQLKSSFNENKIGLLKSNNKFIPIIIGEKNKILFDIIKNVKIKNINNELIPISSLISISTRSDYKTIIADKQSEYIPVNLLANNNAKMIEEDINNILKNSSELEADFSGSIFRNRELLNELEIVLLISVLLLYFILAAQFESLIQPIIVLLEILFDLSGALIMLIIFGNSLNIMSAIGIIVMGGIIINDSILKVDTINQLKRQDIPLLKAIKIGGKRRLKPIIMTSLTTILALFPLLFSSGIGVELQIPLALAIIGGMTIGTIVSLYFIPIAYWFIYKNS